MWKMHAHVNFTLLIEWFYVKSIYTVIWNNFRRIHEFFSHCNLKLRLRKFHDNYNALFEFFTISQES